MQQEVWHKTHIEQFAQPNHGGWSGLGLGLGLGSGCVLIDTYPNLDKILSSLALTV